jgi:GTP pyrophosphokinase
MTSTDQSAATVSIARLLELHTAHHPDSGDPESIRRAFEVARDAHGSQTRKTGEPYITHPIAVAEVLAGYGMDVDTIAAALLHDVVEDTPVTLEEIQKEFGDEVAHLIDGVTKLDRVRFDSKEEQQAATIRKMVVAMARDVRVLLIKLADRLHNMRTLGALAPEKQQRIAAETLEVYAPLAHRLGAQDIKHELESRCFEILHPKRHAEIEELIQQRSPHREAVIEDAIARIHDALSEAGIDAEVSGRPKHHYSIYRKMVEQGRPFEEIHDLIGLRVIVRDLPSCYAALGVIHAMWKPLHGRFKDFVAMPKFNLYQSIHTTVIGPDGKALEVQVRSWEMHQRAEYGIAAHWRYKEGVSAEDVPWLADLEELEDGQADPEEFLNDMKLDLYQDEVFVVTPAGDVKVLPLGATPVDFAYAVHTEVGHKCSGAKVNGRLVPLDTKLESGDVVEIMTSKASDAGPSRDWAGFVSSARARSRIKQWFQRERREAAQADGRDRVMDLLRKEGLGLGQAARDRILTAVAADLGHKDLSSLYAAVGEGGLTAAMVVTRVLREARPEQDLAEAADEDLLAPATIHRTKATGSGIIVEGYDDMWVRIARCCAPVPGDPIIGFVTIGHGVSVHRSDCVNVGGFQEERLVDVQWAPDRIGAFAVWIQVEALDRSGLLRDVTTAVSDVGGNILASSSVTGRDRTAILRYEVELADPGQIHTLLAGVRSVDGVYEAQRIVPHGAGG